jgi:hypothetical protein
VAQQVLGDSEFPSSEIPWWREWPRLETGQFLPSLSGTYIHFDLPVEDHAFASPVGQFDVDLPLLRVHLLQVALSASPRCTASVWLIPRLSATFSAASIAFGVRFIDAFLVVDIMLVQDWFAQFEVFFQAGANLHEN